MDKDLDLDLVEKHPLLFADRGRSMMESCMCWGFPGNGWYPLIKELADKLEPLIEKWVEENPRCDCNHCGCKYFAHRSMPSGKRICTTVHELPYRLFKPQFSCSIPQWKRDLKQAWKGNDWSSKSRVTRFRKALKQLFEQDWDYTKYRFKSKAQRVCNIWYKLGIKEKVPCQCIEWESRHPRASQVKEKFGTLSFYMSSATDEMYKLISEAERKSGETCEDCGAPGKRRGGGWIVTMCDSCAKLADKVTYEEWIDEMKASESTHVLMSFNLKAKADGEH